GGGVVLALGGGLTAGAEAPETGADGVGERLSVESVGAAVLGAEPIPGDGIAVGVVDDITEPGVCEGVVRELVVALTLGGDAAVAAVDGVTGPACFADLVAPVPGGELVLVEGTASGGRAYSAVLGDG